MNPVLTIDLRGCWYSNISFHERRDAIVRELHSSSWRDEDLNSLLDELSEARDLLTYAVVWRSVTYLADLHHVKLIY